MIIYRLNQSEMKKYIELGTLDVKIGPFSRILDVETSSLRFVIYAIASFGFESSFESLPVLLHDQIPSQSIRNEKYIELGTLNVKIRPFLKNLG